MRRRTFVHEKDKQSLEIWRGGQLLAVATDYPISFTIEDCIEDWCSLWFEELRKLTVTSSNENMTLGVFESAQRN